MSEDFINNVTVSLVIEIVWWDDAI